MIFRKNFKKFQVKRSNIKSCFNILMIYTENIRAMLRGKDLFKKRPVKTCFEKNKIIVDKGQ